MQNARTVLEDFVLAEAITTDPVCTKMGNGVWIDLCRIPTWTTEQIEQSWFES